jgi:hypothetical protein
VPIGVYFKSALCYNNFAMSKKKNKFKKLIKEQMLREMTKETVAAKVTEVTEPVTSIPKAVSAGSTAESVENLPLIKADLLKTAIIIGVMAVLIAFLVILDHKYAILLKFGDVLFKVLHIQ